MKPNRNPRRSVLDIPEEIWLEIISKLNADRESNLHLPSLSLVCKYFLSIVNIHKHTLRILEPTVHFLPSLLLRFPNLKHISIKVFAGHPYKRPPNPALSILHRIADFNYRLESLDLSVPIDALVKSLPVSTLVGVKSLRICSSIADDDLKLIGDFFPYLEELDLRPSPDVPDFEIAGFECDGEFIHCLDRSDGDDNGPFNYRDSALEEWGDGYYSESPEPPQIIPYLIPYHGLSLLASKLKGLRRVKLKQFGWVTDEGVISLSDNCPNLVEIVVKECSSVTKIGSQYALWKCRNLKAVKLDEEWASDVNLIAMVNADLQLKSCTLNCEHVTYDVLSLFLRRYNSLDHLALQVAHSLSDESMITLAKSLKEVKSLEITQCCYLSERTLFTLIQQCPMLESLVMMYSSIGKIRKNDFEVDSALKCKIKTLNLGMNPNLSDALLWKIALACPELEELRLRNVNNCRITRLGIWEILRNCPRLRHLAIDGCEKVDSLNLPDKNTLALEFLGASRTGLTDTALIDISSKCPNLKSLNVMGCCGLTSKGVIHIVEYCSRLREIYLLHCHGMTDAILAWMIIRRPSLMKIVPPRGHVLSAFQEDVLRHECYLSNYYY